jgi:hypothetical protein
MSDQAPTKLTHDKNMARDFLAGLDPSATRFTFQFFSDAAGRHTEVFDGTLDEVWQKVQALNTPQTGVGVFVTVNETDLKGRRRTENIIRARALFVDADSQEQTDRCIETFRANGATPSIVVSSGRGVHFYFFTDDIPRDKFSSLQKSLIATVGTDGAVTDLPRVMRLPGTLHLKDPTKPQLVKLHNSANCPIRRWKLSELTKKLGLSPPTLSSVGIQSVKTPPSTNHTMEFTEADRLRLHKFFGHLPHESLADGLETNIEEIRSAVAAIPPSAIATEPDWMEFARALAFEAVVFNKKQANELWEICDAASRMAPGYDQDDNRRRFQRYMNEALDHENPITIGTVFYKALEHGWQGWSPPIAPTNLEAVRWPAADFQISFAKVPPHRRWLYGTYLIRGEITVLASPGGAGKTALATGIAVEVAIGTEVLGEKIFGSNLKVLFINAEDGGSELMRRIWAFCLAHTNKLAGQNLGRLYVAGADDARVQNLSFLQASDKNVSLLNPAGFKVLETALEALRPDLVILDPLVALCGGGNMNDNAVMSQVLRQLKRLAAKFDCAVLIVHHTRKNADGGDAEAISGAAATVNLARRAIMPVPMTKDETKDFGVLPSERFRFFKVVDAKSNLAPRSADSPWYQLRSVELPNAEYPIYPNGDNVQAVERVDFPVLMSTTATKDDYKIRCAISDVVDRGKVIDGKPYPYAPNTSGAENQRAVLKDAMAAVAAATAPRQWLPDDLKAVTVSTIKQMKAEGLLVVKELKELVSKPDRFRRGKGLAVNRLSKSNGKGTPENGDTAAVVTAPNGGQLVNGATDE